MADKVDKERQALAKLILESQDVSYESWLNTKHLEVITGNVKVLQEGLEARNTK